MMRHAEILPKGDAAFGQQTHSPNRNALLIYVIRKNPSGEDKKFDASVWEEIR